MHRCDRPSDVLYESEPINPSRSVVQSIHKDAIIQSCGESLVPWLITLRLLVGFDEG